MTNHIYAYEKMPDDLEVNGVTLTDWEDLPEINRILNNKFSFYGNYKIDGKDVGYLKKGNFIKALDQDLRWKYFEIYDIVKNLNSYSVTARTIGYMANRNFIEYSFTSAGNGTKIMNNLKAALAFKQPFNYLSNVPTVHQFTVKQAKPIEAIIGSNNGSQNLVGVTAAELDMDNYDLKLVKQIGADKGYRVDLGINLEAVEEEINDDNTYNSLYLIGGVPENDYDEEKDPITHKYLEVKGVTDENRRIGKFENSSITDEAELIKWGQTLFDVNKVHEPKITHTVSMVSLEYTLEYGDLYDKLSRLHFGDVVYCTVKKLGIEVKERMVEYTWFPTLGKYKQVVLGNDLSLYTNKVNTETQQLKSKIDNRTEVMVQNILNATAWITGNRGGHVIFRPEKAPSEILIMDTRDVATAKRVWRWNLSGLGYSSNGINGPYGIAITSNGEIVADYIKAGVLSGILIQGVALKTMDDDDFQVVIEGGAVSFEKLVESTNLQDVHGEKLGLISATYGSKHNINGFAVIQKPGYIFSINSGDEDPTASTSKAVFQVPADSTAEDRKYNLFGKGTFSSGEIVFQNKVTFESDVVFNNNVEIKGYLTINGEQVYPGQSGGSGGGGWNGSYPSEISGSADKFAWQLWIWLISNGYSKAAAAGILGNVRGEVGAGMNPDTAQSGGSGPGYGCVQWDGSAYPLVGSPTYNGRQYVQTLMQAANITDDYRTMTAQAKLIEWCMHNGQWIGAVSPTSVAGFKAVSDPATAATGF